MSYEIIIALITFIFVVLTVALVPYLKNKGVWLTALFAVNIAEQICDFFGMRGMGEEKYAFVKRILLMINEKLTIEQIDSIIETLVKKMNELKGAK